MRHNVQPKRMWPDKKEREHVAFWLNKEDAACMQLKEDVACGPVKEDG